MTRALVIVDVQNDFCEGGSLAVTGGAEAAARISRHVTGHRDEYATVVATRDHHVDPGSHFSSRPDFRDNWPPHCVVGTAGVELHPGLDAGPIEDVFDKGEHQAAYSGFEGVDANGTGLADYLRGRGIDALDIAGIATDYCVRATALDGVRAGFEVRVLADLCVGVADDTSRAALAELTAAGAEVI